MPNLGRETARANGWTLLMIRLHLRRIYLSFSSIPPLDLGTLSPPLALLSGWFALGAVGFDHIVQLNVAIALGVAALLSVNLPALLIGLPDKHRVNAGLGLVGVTIVAIAAIMSSGSVFIAQQTASVLLAMLALSFLLGASGDEQAKSILGTNPAAKMPDILVRHLLRLKGVLALVALAVLETLSLSAHPVAWVIGAALVPLAAHHIYWFSAFLTAHLAADS